MTDIARFHQDRRDRERGRDFRVIFFLSYPLFLAGAVVGRLLPGAKAATFGEMRRRSVFAEARATADCTIPFAF